MAKETSHCGGRRRLRLFLSNRRFAEAVDKSVDLSATLKPEEVAEMKEIAFSTIILCLVYYVLPQINDAKTVKQVWAQLSLSLCQISYISRRDSLVLKWIQAKI